MLNFGTDSDVWLNAIALIVVLGPTVFLAVKAVKLWIKDDWEQFGRASVVYGVIAGMWLILSSLFFFVAYGNGVPPTIPDAADDGFVQQTNKAPPEPTKEELKRNAESHKDPALRDFDKEIGRVTDPEVLKKEQQEADERIKKALQRNKELEKESKK